MVKKKRVSHGKKKVPVLATGGTVLSIADLVFGKAVGYEKSAWEYIKLNNYQNAGVILGKQAKEWKTWAPLVGGIAGSMLASRSGANRYLSAIPFVKL